MSIVAAFSTGEGMILCADSEETVADYAKRRVEKITLWGRKSAEFHFAIAGAGAGHYADMLIFDLRNSIFESFAKYDPEKIIQFIQQKVADFYAMHSLPRGNEAPVEFLSVLVPNAGLGLPLLVHVTETAVNVVQHERRCIGIGSYLAEFILEHILSPYGGKHHLIAVAAYMLKEVRDNVVGCGKDSSIYFFGNDGSWENISQEFLARFEQRTDEMNEVMRDAFHYITEMGTKYNPHPETAISHLTNELTAARERQKKILSDVKAEFRFWANYGGEKP